MVNDNTQELLFQAQHGDFQARERLTEKNIPLVKSIARRFNNFSHDQEDLFQVGCIGLLKAIDRFELDRQVCFSTYAVPLIIGEIRRYLRDFRPLYVGRTLWQQAVAIERCRAELRNTMGKEPDLAAIARKCGLSQEQVVTAVESQRPPISFSDIIKDDQNKKNAEDRYASLSSDESEDIAERLSMAKMLEELPERLSYIVRGRYFEEKTQTALAKELNISQVQISRLEKKALALIKEKMKE